MIADAPPERGEAALQRVGLGYRRCFNGGVVLTINRLREGRGELTGELTATRVNGAGPPTGEHLAHFRLNLTSLSARKTAAGYLGERMKEIRWTGLLEAFCSEVLAAERDGYKLELVGCGPLPDEPDTLLGPMLPVGEVSLLYARKGTGKSTVAAAIVLSVETGADVIPGWRPAFTAPVLVLDFEGRSRTWTKRLMALAKGARIPERPVRYLRMRGRLTDEIEAVAEIVSQHAVGFVVVDGTEKAIGAGHGDGDGFKDRAQRLFEALDLLGGVTVLLIDHVSGQDARTDDDEAGTYGSVFKENWARQVWRLKREQEPQQGRAEVLLKCRYYNDGELPTPVGLAIVYDPDSVRFELANLQAPELVRATLTRPQQVLHALRAGHKPVKALAEGLDLPDYQVRSILSDLRRAQKVVKVGNGWGLKA